jgi:hypothetical protein
MALIAGSFGRTLRSARRTPTARLRPLVAPRGDFEATRLAAPKSRVPGHVPHLVSHLVSHHVVPGPIRVDSCHSWAILFSSVCSVCSVDCLLLSAFRSLLVAFEGMFQTSEASGGALVPRAIVPRVCDAFEVPASRQVRSGLALPRPAVPGRFCGSAGRSGERNIGGDNRGSAPRPRRGDRGLSPRHFVAIESPSHALRVARASLFVPLIVAWPSAFRRSGGLLIVVHDCLRRNSRSARRTPTRHSVALWFLPYGRIARDSLHRTRRLSVAPRGDFEATREVGPAGPAGPVGPVGPVGRCVRRTCVCRRKRRLDSRGPERSKRHYRGDRGLHGNRSLSCTMSVWSPFQRFSVFPCRPY